MQEDSLLKDKVLIHSRASLFFHWAFAVVITLLLLSSFYIHRPLVLGPLFNMGKNLFVHRTMAYTAMGIFTGWTYYIIVTGDYRNLLFRFRDIREFPAFFRYNLFLEQKLPPHGKYNVGQKLIYSGWFFAFVFLAVTGLFLQFPAWANYVPPLTLQQIRYYHFLVALYFLATIPLHVYLAVTEDPARLQAIFTGWVKKKQKDPFKG